MLGERLSAWFGADHSSVVRDVLSGKERILPLVDVRSYYPCRTLSACHFAALNFVRVAFKHTQRARGNLSPSMLRWLTAIMERHVLEDMLSPCEQLTGEHGIQLEEMYRIPLFESTLRHAATKHGPPSMILLKQSLRQMQLHASPVSAMVVSRNTSTTVCLKLRENTKDVFLVLDFALAQPEHGYGRGTTLALVISTSLEQTAARLSGVLPVDNHLVTRDRQWQAQLFASCTICMFTPAEGVALSSEAESLVINESVALLRVMGERDDRGRDWDWERDASRDRNQNRRQRDQPSGSNHRELWERTPFDVGSGTPTTSRGHAGRAGGVSLGEGSTARMAELHVKTTFIPYEQSKRHCRIFFPDDEPPAPTSPSPMSVSSEGSDEEACFECVICFEDIPEEEGIHLLPCAHGFCRGCLAGHVCSKIEEHRFPVFCPLCMAEQGNANPSGEQPPPVQSQVVADEDHEQSCPEPWFNDSGYPRHSTRSGPSSKWRICVCGYIVAGDRHADLPLCPTWNSCGARCNRSAFVDKEDYEQLEELRCPFPGCKHTWCKKCEQSLSGDRPKHSCDGTEELDYLVRQMGWKYCPKCRTPVQKNGGCNHMTCATPGCNTHFCYRCGKQITRASIPFLVRSAVNAHFKQCTL